MPASNAERQLIRFHKRYLISHFRPEDEIVGLFQKFRRAKNAQGKAGWGLGLTTVKGITEADGGNVKVESTKEAGTTFKVTLPLVTAEALAERPQPTM